MFGSQPQTFVPPPTPAPLAQETQPTSAKPPKKASQPSFIGAIAPTPQQTGQRTLLGGAPTQLGTA